MDTCPYPSPPRTRPDALRLLAPAELPGRPGPPPSPPEPHDPGEKVPQSVFRAAHALARALTEVLQGHRPPHRLESVLAPDALRLAGRLAGDPSFGTRLRLRSIRVQAPAEGVAEAALVWSDGRRGHAAALRLEAHDARWVCVELETTLRGRVVRTRAADAA